MADILSHIRGSDVVRTISQYIKPNQFYHITLELEPATSTEDTDWMSSLKKLKGIWKNNPDRENEMRAIRKEGDRKLFSATQ